MSPVLAADDGVGIAVLIVLWLILAAAFVGLLVLWIIKLIEVVKLPEAQYANASSEKLTWVLVVAIAGWIGALIWQFGSTRKRVLAASPVDPRLALVQQAPRAVPPGWYADPQVAGMLRWWDGLVWTEHRQPVPAR